MNVLVDVDEEFEVLELGDVSVSNFKTGTRVTHAVTRWTTDTTSNVRVKS